MRAWGRGQTRGTRHFVRVDDAVTFLTNAEGQVVGKVIGQAEDAQRTNR